MISTKVDRTCHNMIIIIITIIIIIIIIIIVIIPSRTTTRLTPPKILLFSNNDTRGILGELVFWIFAAEVYNPLLLHHISVPVYQMCYNNRNASKGGGVCPNIKDSLTDYTPYPTPSPTARRCRLKIYQLLQRWRCLSQWTNVPQEEGFETLCRAYDYYYKTEIPIPTPLL